MTAENVIDAVTSETYEILRIEAIKVKAKGRVYAPMGVEGVTTRGRQTGDRGLSNPVVRAAPKIGGERLLVACRKVGYLTRRNR